MTEVPGADPDRAIVRGRFALPLAQAVVADDWSARGYSCHLFVDPPGQVWPDFVHATNELVTVAEGRLELEIDGERLTAEPGDEVFIARGAVHTVRNLSGGTTRWLFGYD